MRGMANSADAALIDVQRRAEELAERLPGGERPDAVFSAMRELQALIDAVRQLDERFTFDAAGRPGAVQAVRHALPSMERELLDAVLDDHACEVAAVKEAMYWLAAAIASRKTEQSSS